MIWISKSSYLILKKKKKMTLKDLTTMLREIPKNLKCHMAKKANNKCIKSNSNHNTIKIINSKDLATNNNSSIKCPITNINTNSSNSNSMEAILNSKILKWWNNSNPRTLNSSPLKLLSLFSSTFAKIMIERSGSIKTCKEKFREHLLANRWTSGTKMDFFHTIWKLVRATPIVLKNWRWSLSLFKSSSSRLRKESNNSSSNNTNICWISSIN